MKFVFLVYMSAIHITYQCILPSSGLTTDNRIALWKLKTKETAGKLHTGTVEDMRVCLACGILYGPHNRARHVQNTHPQVKYLHNFAAETEKFLPEFYSHLAH